MSEEYSVGYSEGYQAGWNAAMDATPPAAPLLEGRDWSLLEATQESLREHMAEIKRLKEAQPAVPLTDEMRKQMKERCDSMEMRGAFADGWLSAEAAHGITKGQP